VLATDCHKTNCSAFLVRGETPDNAGKRRTFNNLDCLLPDGGDFFAGQANAPDDGPA
jgi:hypothetical protein